MSSFNEALDAFNDAHAQYVKGDPDPVLAVFSEQDDVTLCNPIGPPQRGVENVRRAGAEPSFHFTDGVVSGYDEVSRYVTADLGYVVRIERGQTHIDGGPQALPFALRVTMIFRREGEVWKLSHRHADPITTVRPLASAMEQPA